ncbi:MAG: methyl-accepting chemotaxis protein [Colwellia sp.]
MITLTLKQKITFSANSAIVIACLLVTLISFISAKSRLTEEIQSRLKNVTSSYNNYVVDWLEAKGAALSAMPTHVEANQIVSHLIQMKHSAKFDNVFMAFSDGANKNANGVILPTGNNDPRKWGWYKNAIANPSQVFMDNPTVAAATGANVVSLGKAQFINGERVVLGADVELTDILNQLKSVILPGNAYMFIATTQGKVFAHNNTELLNQPASNINAYFSQNMLNSLAQNKAVSVKNLSGEKAYIYVAKINGTHLYSVAVVNYDSVISPLYEMLYTQTVVTLLAIVVCAFLLNLLCRILFMPLTHMSDALSLIAQGGGDLTQRINIKTNDEIGVLASNFNTFIGSLQSLISHVRAQSVELGQLAKISEQQCKKSVEDLDTQQQEISLVVTAVTEMAASTKEIAFNAEKTAETVNTSSTQTIHGKELVMNSRATINELAQEITQATDVISELNQHAKTIDSILSTIQGIAEQTNLLALNAAIEAARAGEQGRGFAVVADEVRVLSQRTHASTEEIQKMINTLQQSTIKAVDIMQSSSTLTQCAVEHSDKAALAIEEISDSVSNISDMTIQIASGAEEQNLVTDDIMRNCVSIQNLAEDVSNDANHNQAQAVTLNNQSNQLNEKVLTFIV